MRLSWRARLGVLLGTASAVLYLVHYLIFRDVYQVAIYGLSDLALLSIEVLLVVNHC
jgi:hypothetical protein